MATIKDVAKQAGVSVTTVSIIINGKAEERKNKMLVINAPYAKIVARIFATIKRYELYSPIYLRKKFTKKL